MPPKNLPRGIAPDLLVSQVRNTMPYLFEAPLEASALAAFTPAQVVLGFAADGQNPLSHFEYFRLCLSAHYLTVATPVPTDVDNQIRLKLWPAELPLETALSMAALVLESHAWDFSLVTRRITEGLSGHLGEWFTVACGAYCALGRYGDPAAQEMRTRLFDGISDEVRHHSEVFGRLWRGGEGLACLKASASIAHNFGDLDRVMDMWELSVADPLRLEFYKLAAEPFDSNRKLRHFGRLWVAGELYKSPIEESSLALENHRHFALRKPRSLRQDPDLMITTGPFLHDWGRKVAGIPELAEVVEALQYGWSRMPKTLGYGAALQAISETRPELRLDKPVRPGALKVRQEVFEKKWSDEALRWMDEIPSRA